MGKKSKQPTKERSEYIYGTTAGAVSELILHVNELTGEITFGSEMTNVYSEVSYEKTKGTKVVSRIPQVNDGLTLDQEAALAKNFDFLCAIDTNTWDIGDRKISAVGIVTLRAVVLPGPTGLRQAWQFDVPFCLTFAGMRAEKPENLGWIAAFQQLFAHGIIQQGARIGAVVDSDLGNINDFNHGRKPVFASFHLPPKTQLIYASADTGKNLLVNKALAVADSVATQTLDAIQAGLAPPDDLKLDSPWCDGMSIIYPKTIRT